MLGGSICFLSSYLDYVGMKCCVEAHTTLSVGSLKGFAYSTYQSDGTNV